MLEQHVALDPFPALARSSISFTCALSRLANPDYSILDESRLAAFDPPGVLLSSKSYWILRLVPELLASLQVIVELVQRQQRSFRILSPRLSPLPCHQQRQSCRSEELQDAGSAQSSSPTAKRRSSRSWRRKARGAVGRKAGLFVHREASHRDRRNEQSRHARRVKRGRVKKRNRSFLVPCFVLQSKQR